MATAVTRHAHPTLNVLSLGAGSQSSALALMAAAGEVEPMPDCAIFADTCAEPQWVYDWLDALVPMLPFPVWRVGKASGLLAAIQQVMERHGRLQLPAFTESQEETGGQLRRECTNDYKVQPIESRIRQLLRAKRMKRREGVQASLWLGISLDEVQRMKSNREPWIQNRWPLIEKRMTRSDCLLWMERHGYPRPRKSSCTFCPFHSNREWAELRQHDPEGWQAALQVDELIRGGVRGTKERLYLHRSLKPLAEIDLRTEQERGQLDLWNNNCEAYCGL